MTRPLQGALIGFGFIAEKGHVPAYLAAADAFEIVAVAEICAARREKAKLVLPKARIYPDVKTLLAAEAKNLDFVDIATPPCDHAAIAHAAFEHGLQCLREADCDLGRRREADARPRRAREAVFFPSHNYKHAPVIKAIRKVLETEELGRIHLVTLDTFRTTHAKGVAEWQPDWRRVRKTSGGGIAMDHGSHTFYLAFEWLAAQPTAIAAKMSNLSTFDTEDNFNCTVTFPVESRSPSSPGTRASQGHLHASRRARRDQGRGRRHRDPPQARRRQDRRREVIGGVALDGCVALGVVQAPSQGLRSPRSARVSGWARKLATPRCASS